MDRFYWALLSLYPRAFRSRYAADMHRAFLDRREDARKAGLLTLARCYAGALLDLLVNAAGERCGRRGPGPQHLVEPEAGSFWFAAAFDARFALRVLWRRPAVSFFSALTLALGIGAVTAVVSVVDAVFIQPLPFPQPEQIVAIRGVVDERPAGISVENLRDLAGQSTTLTAASPFFAQSVNLTGVPEPDRLRGAFVTSAFFDVVGIRPALGAPFAEETDVAGGPRVVVLTHATWQRRFAARDDVVGQTLMLNNAAFTVIGVMPASFTFPIDEAEVFLPLWTTTAGISRGNHNFIALGRLAPGAGASAASAEAAAIAAHLERAYPDINHGRGAIVEPLKDALVEDSAHALQLLVVMVAIMLATACANVAGLQLGDGVSRRHEMSIRAALGAGRARMVRQLLMESVARALAGAALGLAAAHVAIRFLITNAPPGIYGLENAALRPGVLLAGVVIAIAAGLAAGLPPALQSGRDPGVGSGARATDDVRTSQSRGALVVGQIALAAVLLVAAGLTIRSFTHLASVDVGFDSSNLLTMEYRLPLNKYPSPGAQTRFHRRVLESISAIPGVVSASGVRALPFSGNGDSADYRLTRDGEVREASFNAVSQSYFDTMRIPLLAGRTFAQFDEKTPAVIISRALADRTWPDGTAVGRSLYFAEVDITATVVGLVGDVHHRDLTLAEAGTIYTLQDQAPGPFNTLAVRTAGSPLALAAAVRRAVWAVDPDQPVWKIRTLESLIDRSIASRRFLLQIVVFFGLSAAGLAVLGLYGVVAAGVAQRTREIGVRITLGATPESVLRLVMMNGLRLGAWGISIGLLAGLFAGTLLGGYLFGVPAWDPLTYVATAALLLGCSLAACCIPAKRALRVDPVIALRQS